jgi:hypothetical protein
MEANMRAMAARTATYALDLEVRWGDGELLSSEHLRGPARYVVQSEKLGAGQSGFVVQEGWLPSADAVLVLAELTAHDALVEHVDGTRQRLAPGEQALLHVGPLVFRVAVVEPRAAAVAPFRFDAERHVWTAASLALHTIVLGCALWLPPRASSLSLDAMSEDDAYARYLNMPLERVEEALPWTADSQEPALSEEGKRARDDSGQAGKPDAAKSHRRLAVQGESETRVLAKRPSTEEVQNAGLLGALAGASANLSPSSPFGKDTAQGSDPVAAIGALFGSQIGDDFGFNGLGMKSTGRGGGGDGEGTIGLGDDLGTGLAARTALGVVGALGPRRREHVPVLRVLNAEVRGSLSKEVIRRTIHRRINEVRYCYESALAKDPQLAGRISVMFMIAPSGAVQAASIKESTLESRSVTDCVTQAVRRMAFPAPDGGGYVQVTYPFSFSAE